MPTYFVESTRRYTLTIDALTEEEALEQADETPIYDWDESEDDYSLKATLIEEETNATL